MASFIRSMAAWQLPLHAWDTHVHVFNPAEYPYSPSRAYTPETAPYPSLLSFERNISAARDPQNLVLVQPSPYGTDNSLITDLLRQHIDERNATNSRKLRAIVVVDEKSVTSQQLKSWDSIGVRGFRINNEASANGNDYEELKKRIVKTSDLAKDLDHWKCQLYISGASWDRK